MGTVYVAVGNNVHKTRQLLDWTIHTFSARPICLLHVHQPYLTDSFNRNLSANEPSDHAMKAFQEQGSKKVHELLDQYILILKKLKVKAKILLIDKDDIEKGIAEAIAQHNIRWLVMGEATDKFNLGELAEQESEKAITVREQAFLSCTIWFICKGKPICTRVDDKHTSEVETAPLLLVLNSNKEAKQSEMINSESYPNALKYSDSGDTEETGNVSSQCSLQSKWSLSSFVGRSKLTDLLFHEDEELECLCAKEIGRRKEVEEQIVRVKQQVQEMKIQQDEIMHELQMVQDQNSALKNQLSESQCTVTELEEKIILAVDLLISFREKRDMLRIEHKNAVRKVKVLKEFREADTKLSYRVEFPTFSFIEINEATNDLDPSWKIGEGRYGSVYKGLLCNMHVAIKMLPSYGSQSQLEFQRQVEILSRVRHPNLLTPIGSSVESRSLVYEYLNNGSLESHLVLKDKTSLPWQIRVSIAANICSALIFLHYSDPCIIHGNLKPSKVLLDANFVAKLSDVGIPCLVQCSADVAVMTTVCRNKNESMAYVDPEYLVTSKLTPESDVYSFGVILLQLLTGRPLFGLVRDMKCALERDNLKSVLDFSAGEWPLYQTKQLACLALRCCEKTWLNRPDLVSEIWGVLEPFRTTCVNMPPYLASKKPHHPPPPHFLCPIVQEVMEEPYIAADGYTYEAEAIKEWLNSGHNTSPMTNLKLEHTDLVPNYVLHNAIQEWQQLI
ncbi:putative protein kinase RLK-Pelle-RLCK-IXb family [Lupinus albus]|uniref:RING-type E3 ubiquitin transferase n=1 Tax=Lupinus albus TaxID=3870 RepID=A0A6A4NR44_LUPAL|nr:putative protein kinase RLK-Pelle-RLCK-IXb family [Lupinus albus]